MGRTKVMAEIQIQNMIDEFGFDAIVEGLISDNKQKLKTASLDNKRLINKLMQQKELLEKLQFVESLLS